MDKETIELLKTLSLHGIATAIKQDWKNMSPHAKPYVNAMFEMENIDDMYGCESERSIVRYFLANAGSWRGDMAKAVKAELKRRLK